MTSEQSAHAAMFAAVRATCDAHPIAWSGMALFATPYAVFAGLLPTIYTAAGLQSTSSEGTTLAKNNLRKSLTDRLLQLADTLVLYAKGAGKDSLRKDAYTTPSTLRNMGDGAVVGRAEKLLSLVNALPVGTLTSLGVDGTFLTNVAMAKDAYVTALGTPRHSIDEGSRGTQELELAMEQAYTILKEDLDPAAEVLKYTQHAFYSEYISAREIVDPATSVRELTVTVHSGQDAAPIEGAEALIVPGNIEKMTGPSGTFYINNMTEGDYQMEVSANGYTGKTASFHITDGQATVVPIVLSPA